MEVVYPRCCGLDVHQKSVTACVLTVEPSGERRKELRTFGTMTDDLLALADWLVTMGCTHVAMERSVLETHLQSSGGHLRTARRQCPAHQDRARPQERRPGRGVDCRPLAARATPGELHSRSGPA